MRKYITLLTCIFSIITFTAAAQLTLVKGKVMDGKTKDPIPFANVIFVGTTMGTITAADGSFSIQSSDNVSYIEVSFIGYKKIKKKIKQGVKQTINVLIEEDAEILGEIVLKESKKSKRDDPAYIMMKKVWANKKKNLPENLSSLEYEKYQKIEFDLNNIDDEFKQKKLFKDFQFIFDSSDTSEINGKVFLPIFITESIYDYHFRKNPRREVEMLKASKVAGFQDNQSVNQYMDALHQDVDIYSNYINLFNKGFSSPLSTSGYLTYKYFLTDSVEVDGVKSYMLQFVPRRKHELTFYGEFWVQSGSWAVEKVNMRKVKDANLNFVNDLVIEQKFSNDNVEKKWLISEDKIFLDFSAFKSKDELGVFGTRTISYKNYRLNYPLDDMFFDELDKQREESELLEKEELEQILGEKRHLELSSQESGIYDMVDSVKNIPKFRTYLDIVNMILTGYYRIGEKFDFGPILSVLSFNDIEGARIRLGGRSSIKFSDKREYSGYLAYGTRDEQLKGSMSYRQLLGTSNRNEVGFVYSNDIRQLFEAGRSLLNTGNLLSSAFATSAEDKLALVEEYKLFWQKDLIRDLTAGAYVRTRNIKGQGNLEFEFLEDLGGSRFDRLHTSEAGLELQYYPEAKYARQNKLQRRRITMADKASFVLGTKIGFSGMLESQFDYRKLYFSYKHPIMLNPLGRLEYQLNIGKTFGDVPYPLLDVAPGNQTRIYSQTRFNQMNYFEYVADEYASLFLEHNFQGLFLNHLPLFRKLNWREIVSFKGLYGRFSKLNTFIKEDDKGRRYVVTGTEGDGQEIKAYAPKDGYFEVGAGIDNIFKFIQIQGVWRLTELGPKGMTDNDFGLLFVAKVRF